MPNRLAGETSPYLQQHAENPVDWHPWGEEALTLAKREGRPILLSIGYSACHWCHVMAHESFEDAEVAAVMNRLFVNIKVDREERPDLDQIYQTAQQMLTGRTGGWPLTMFLTPDGAPFFGGTYFPKAPRYGLPGFPDLCQRVAEAWRDKRADIAQQNGELLKALSAGAAARPLSGALSAAPLQLAVERAAQSYDPQFGGFGGAPKFPHPADLELLLRRNAATGEARCGEMALTTLRRMAEGGIYDQLGGGFCRYSVDERWAIPHFEKMLYDNGPLLRLYADAWRVSGDPLFRRVAEETAGWVLREMQAPEGGYYSSLDADSEHEEGKFYVWSREEVSRHTTAEEYAVVAAHYGLERPANFEGAHWHLLVALPLAEVAASLGRPLDECERLLASAREKLFAAREQRIRPGRDEKILVSWNALMIEGMTHAGRVCSRSDWLASARRALDFIRKSMWRDGRLLATYKDGRAHLNAYLDDYAYLLKAALEMLQAEFDAELLAFAEALGEALLAHFEDAAGGFWFTSHDHEALIHRVKTGHDSAMPSGNGAAAFALQRLGHVTGETRFLEAADRTLRLYYPDMERQPGGFATLLAALDEAIVPPAVVVLRGPQDQLAEWKRKISGRYWPWALTLGLPAQAGTLPPALNKPLKEGVNAWVCSGVTCLEPIDDFPCLERVCKSPELI
ncbi:MAG: thioredoxin domain-containing protein [Rhodocyclaceae bacterium]|uniref:Thioredoxin domain-containing protein n=1 Tax=Candidatus Desulfobacillus denitrificans TaxID=2608985 RepID=A0A809RSH8_9PROT|nr:thioredoxin domain-containing protein [Rhodocyclaceae bacterium]BBO19417.1 thioredoxin domain-containing protein [Candidatus Desulfobacillus denitrificans]GIK45403.1 MAG: thioredoxin domain-containing protein [Betaproteobacteria bacterium]GJQ54291.1 MAG: thioredoxin domain-containing protein [Rhodocyclaceae bacterium]